MIELEYVKNYLRVDSDADNDLIASILKSASNLVEDIMRRKLEDFEEVPEVVNNAILLLVATMYENRQVGKEQLLIDSALNIVRSMLFSYREEKY